MLRPHAMTQAGGITLLFAATMLLLVAATAAAMLQMLLAGRQLAAAGRDREIAFRAAEAALLEAELRGAGRGRGPGVEVIRAAAEDAVRAGRVVDARAAGVVAPTTLTEPAKGPRDG